MIMTREEKHLSVLSIYLEQMEKRYDREFKKLGDSLADETRVPQLVELYHKIEGIKKEIGELKKY